MFWLFSVVQAPPSPSQRASTPRCQQAPSQTWRTLLPATSTSRRRGSSGRRCPSKMSFLGRPSQLGESEKDRRLVARGTKVSDASAQRHCLLPTGKIFCVTNLTARLIIILQFSTRTIKISRIFSANLWPLWTRKTWRRRRSLCSSWSRSICRIEKPRYERMIFFLSTRSRLGWRLTLWRKTSPMPATPTVYSGMRWSKYLRYNHNACQTNQIEMNLVCNDLRNCLIWLKAWIFRFE